VIALARMAGARSGELAQAMLHAQERDGAAWTQEWLVLPDLVLATGAALRQAQGLISGLRVNPDRMTALILADGAPALAEACVFALAAYMPKAAATQLVAETLPDAKARNLPLPRVLAERTPVPVDWASLERPQAQLGAAPDFIAAVRAAFDAAERKERTGDA
jgi:3-carboxy-cis,cis-muconate cycloisomerase